MPNRIIREGILSSERVCSLDWASEVFYRRLLSIVDDYGRFEAGSSLLRAKCYPLQVDRVREADISRWMAACQKAGLIVFYKGVQGGREKHFLQVTDFRQQQRTESKYPAPDGAEELPLADHLLSNAKQKKSNAHLVVSVVEGEGGGVFGPSAGDDFPPELQTTEFKEAWADWIVHRKEIGHALKPTQTKGQLKQLAGWGATTAVVALRTAIARGWRGFFLPEAKDFQAAKPKPAAAPTQTPEEQKQARERYKQRFQDSAHKPVGDLLNLPQNNEEVPT